MICDYKYFTSGDYSHTECGLLKIVNLTGRTHDKSNT